MHGWMDGLFLSLCVSLSLSVFSHSLSSDILARLAEAGLFAKRQLQEQEQEQEQLLLPYYYYHYCYYYHYYTRQQNSL